MDGPDFLRQLRRQATLADREKALYWRRYKLECGAAAGIRIAEALRCQVLTQRPGWPSPEERAEDHVAHERVVDVLARTASRAR